MNETKYLIPQPVHKSVSHFDAKPFHSSPKRAHGLSFLPLSNSCCTKGAGRFQEAVLYSDYPLTKEQREREKAEGRTETITGPLLHQCAGHETVFKTVNGRVCKPLDNTEFWFYKTCLKEYPQYKPFVPLYHGVVTLSQKQLLSLINKIVEEDVMSNGSSSSEDEGDGSEDGAGSEEENNSRQDMHVLSHHGNYFIPPPFFCLW